MNRGKERRRVFRFLRFQLFRFLRFSLAAYRSPALLAACDKHWWQRLYHLSYLKLYLKSELDSNLRVAPIWDRIVRS
jgi:hypothetical protein